MLTAVWSPWVFKDKDARKQASLLTHLSQVQGASSFTAFSVLCLNNVCKLVNY